MKKPDVAIVGSGIAGTTIAFLLTQWGRTVAMFEAGPRYEYPHRPQYEDEIMHLYRDPRHVIARDLRRLVVTGNYKDSESLAYEQIMVVGGMATRWSAWTPRYGVNDFRTQSQFGYGQDWPITYAELEPYYCRAEALIGISGTDEDNPFAPPRSRPLPLPAFAHSYEDRLLMDRLKQEGLVAHTVPQARTSAAYDGRPGCVNFGVCGVCPIGARYSPNHHLELALQTGKLTLHTDAAVRRVMVRPDGHAGGLLYYQENRRQAEQGARAVVVAAGAIESARLLLHSAGEGGAAQRINQSGQVGQNLMFNHIYMTAAHYKDHFYTGRIGASTAQSQQFADPPDRRKHGGVKVDFQSAMSGAFGRDHSGRGGNAWQEGPSPVQLEWESTDDVLADIGSSCDTRAFAVHAETVASPSKFVTLSSSLDRFGDAFARVHHQSNAFDEEARLYAAQVGKDFALKSGAEDFEQPRRFSNGHHHLGTCRMGADPEGSVVDGSGRAHGVPNLYVVGASTFPGSSSMNPTLTLVALAIRTAERIHASLP